MSDWTSAQKAELRALTINSRLYNELLHARANLETADREHAEAQAKIADQEARIAVLSEALKRSDGALEEMCLHFGGPHQRSCPEDDTCSCAMVEKINSAARHTQHVLSTLPRQASAMVEVVTQ